MHRARTAKTSEHRYELEFNPATPTLKYTPSSKPGWTQMGMVSSPRPVEVQSPFKSGNKLYFH